MNSEFVTLALGRQVFGIDVAMVREIFDLRPITPLPQAPAFLLGMIDVRGLTVPVIDMRIKLGMPMPPPTSDMRVLVLEITVEGRALCVGLLAEKVFEVTALDNALVEPAPDIGMRWQADFITGVGRRGEAFVVIINPQCLFAADVLTLAVEHRMAAE